MTNENPPTELRTERLHLRPFQLEDVDDVFEYASDPEWAPYLPIPQPYQRHDAEEFIAKQVLASWETSPAWAVVLDGKVVGGLSVRIDAKNERAELGYAIARDQWGEGIVPEGARSVIDWAFGERGLAKVFARAAAGNSQSLRVMAKLGMTREGVLRSHVKGRDERIDDVYCGLLREEWEERQGRD